MLRGAPQSPLYAKQDIHSYTGPQSGSDKAYDQMNGAGWSYWAQTDWSGGFQRLKWKDDATFKDGQGVDVLGAFGQIQLDHDFTSAVSISGSHKYGAHIVHDNNLILGTIKAGAAKVFKITSANVVSTLSAMVGISAVNSMSRFGDATLIGMTRTSGSAKTLAKYLGGTTISGFRSTNPIVRAVRGVGIRAYISEYVAAISGDRLSYATNLSAFTSAYNIGKNRKCPAIVDLYGTPYFFIEDGRKVSMYRYDELQERPYHVYTWNDLTSWGVTNFASVLKITGTSNGLRVAFAFNGSRLWPTFDDQLQDSSYDFSKPFEFNNNLHVKGAMWDGQAWFPGLYGKYATVQYTPFANFANKAYGYALTGSVLRLGYLDTSKRQISGNVVGSNFGHETAGVDKLINTAIVNTKPLASGQMIELLRSTNEGTSYTTIGTMKYSTEGALTNKAMYFPSGFVSKTWLYKAVLVGPGTTTPAITDIAFEYRPAPDMKRRWSISIDAGDNVKLLNGQNEQRDGKSLMSELWSEREAKRAVIFEDVDSCSAKIVSAMTSAATTARVDETRLFPRKGRIRVVVSGVAEEMTYTSADGGKILGLARGQKGTKARAYTTAHRFDNFYTVIVTDVQEQINNTDDKKTESIARVNMIEI